jgi:hypothetical protein
MLTKASVGDVAGINGVEVSDQCFSLRYSPIFLRRLTRTILLLVGRGRTSLSIHGELVL